MLEMTGIPKLISKYELGYFLLIARKTKQAAPPNHG